MPNESVLIVLWTTSRCNLNCKYCYAAAGKKKADMDFETARAALDYFADHPIKIQFAGGEPLLNYALIERVVGYAKAKHLAVSFQMQTNGTLINAEIAAGIKKMSIAVGVSLDGTPQINERLRGKTREAIAGIQLLGQAGIKANINAVVTAQNVAELPELVKFAFYLGNVPGIGLDILREVGNAKTNEDLVSKASPEQLVAAVTAMQKESQALFKLSGKRVRLREIEEARKRLSCSACSREYCYASCGRSYVIVPNGDVYPCGSLIDRSDYFMGNVKAGPIEAIALTKNVPAYCDECDYHAVCPGGCPSRLIVNQPEQERSLDCILKKTAFEIVSANEVQSE